MSSEIVDLDAIAPKPKKVKLGGKTYTLPGDLPVETVLAIEQAEQAEKDGAAPEVNLLYKHLLDLFQVHHPEIKKLPIGMVQLLLAIPTIYFGVGGKGKPTRKTQPRGASRGSTSVKRSSSRSRSRS